MKTRILILSAATWWLQGGTWAQRIPVNDNPTTADAISSLDESSITEQIAINRTDANPSPLDPESPSDGGQQEEEEPVPISVVLFDGSPGPKENCRGNAILRIGLTKPGTDHTTPTCYNVSSSSSSSSSRIAVAQCGNFLANKDDGCEAKVFSEPGCREFSNVAVFVPEVKAFGGYMRSLEVACGIVGVVPAPLKLPGLELPPGAVQAVG